MAAVDDEHEILERGCPCGGKEHNVPVLYLDIDGTVREGKGDALGRFVNCADDVRVFPEAIEMMRRWKAGGGRIIGISNQGGVALGIVAKKDVIEAMLETQRQAEGLFDAIAFCEHHPDATNPEAARCWCRKPRVGLVVEATCDVADNYPHEVYPVHMALFVGDRAEDKACAEAANIDFLDAAEWRAQANPKAGWGSWKQ